MNGTWTLVRLALRRDRLLLPLWIAVVVVVVVATASAIAGLYPGIPERTALAAMIGANPALRAFAGPVLAPGSVGGLTAWRVVTLATVLAGLMSVLVVTRHTRAEEETGRAELVGAGAVDRHALPAAAVLVTAGANLAITLIIAAALVAQGLPAAGSLALGAAVGGTGWVFGALAVLAAQLTASGRAANAFACAALGVAFLLRAAGDAVGVDALGWSSPLGWAQRVRPFAGDRWWVAALMVAAGLALCGAAALLVRRRDLGSGLLPHRRGRAAATASLRSPAALAWRLQRGTLLGWTIVFAVTGALLGTLAESARDIVSDNPQIAGLLARVGAATALVDTFLAAQLGVLALIAAGYAVQAVLRLRAEEAAVRAEPILSTAVGRWRWLAGHLAVAVAGSTLIMAVAGVAVGLAHGLRTGEPLAQAVRVLGAALVQVPAVWVLAGLALFVFGLAPRMTALAWAALVAFALLGQLGQLLQIDERIRALSPFAHVPRAPAEPVTAAPLLLLGAVAAALVVLGAAAFRRRDLSSD